MSATPRNAQKSTKNRCKMGGQKRPRKKRREIDTVGRNVLKKVPKGQPKGSQMEPETEPKSSIIDPLASQMQQSSIFRSR